jgi:RNA polymerase-binding transcription factor DksA
MKQAIRTVTRAGRSSHELAQTPRLRKQLERLLQLRDQLGRTVCQLRAEACEENTNYSLHMADAATDSFDRDLLLGLASFEQEGLYEIEAALKRIEDGTYGICELTGKPIGWERLQAIPWTRFSLEAENQLERHICPHIGRLDAVWPAEKERHDASDDFANQERVLSADLDLFQRTV